MYADAFLAVMLADGPRPQSEIGDEGMLMWRPRPHSGVYTHSLNLDADRGGPVTREAEHDSKGRDPRYAADQLLAA